MSIRSAAVSVPSIALRLDAIAAEELALLVRRVLRRPRCSRSSAARFCSALGPPRTLACRLPWRDALNPTRSRVRGSTSSAVAFHASFDRFSLSFALLSIAVHASITACAASCGSSVSSMRSMSPGEIFASPSTRDCSQRIEAGPVVPAEEDDRELIDLAGLDERQRLERFVERAEAAGEDDERVRVLDEHRLPDEEVAEVHQRIDVRVGALLEGQLDVAADRAAAAELGALVRRLHDARAGAGDDREARLGEQARDVSCAA